jgi:hypothetical protein
MSPSGSLFCGRTMSASEIRIATTAEELSQVYRFRYEIYVAEMGRTCAHVDHRQRQLRHSLDETGVNIVAYSCGSVVGALRTNFSLDGPFGIFRQFYGIRLDAHTHPAQTSISTGLMVAATHRHRFVAPRLAIAGYELALRRDARWSFIDCIPSLAPFFKQFGWIEHLPEAKHPDYSFPVKRMRLDLYDEDHLNTVRLPFLMSYRKHQRERSEERRSFTKECASYSTN